MKLLRTYKHIAQQMHFCDRCNRDINPGEEYEGRVYATRKALPPTLRMSSDQYRREVSRARVKKSVIIFKEHSEWCHDPFEDEMREEAERERFQSKERAA